MPSEVASIVRFHRKKAGLTQKELAKLAGIGKTALFEIEKGKESMRWNTLCRVLRVLNIQVDFKSPLMEQYQETNHEAG